MASFLNLETTPEGALIVRSYRIVAGQQELVGEAAVDADRVRCQEDRWFFASSSTHESWDLGQHESYDPAFVAAHYVGTFGLGAPLSNWWNYLFAVTVDGSLVLRRMNMSSAVYLGALYGRTAKDDDFFLFPATDTRTMVAAAAGAAGVEETPLPAAPTQTEAIAELQGRTCVGIEGAASADLFALGKGLFDDQSYAAARDCFQAAAMHPAGAHTEAMWYLCVIYENGYGVEPDLETARAWCTRMRKPAP